MDKTEVVKQYIEEFLSSYKEFIDKLNLSDDLSNKLQNINIEFSNDTKDIEYDTNTSSIKINYNFFDDEDSRFKFYRIMLDVLTTKKEDGYTYIGVCAMKGNSVVHSSLNNMLANYVCNSISSCDIDDNNRVFMSTIEYIVNCSDLVRHYFNNDIVGLYSSFKESGLDMNDLSSMLDKYNEMYHKKQDNDYGTNIYKKLYTGAFLKSKKTGKDIQDFDISNIVNGDIGFLGVEKTDNLYNILNSTYKHNFEHTKKSF